MSFMIQLFNEDCLEKLHQIPSNSIDCIIIDPPYIGMVNESWDRISNADAKNLFAQVISHSSRILRYGGRFISFASNDTLQFLYSDELKHREILVVDKCVAFVSSGRNTRQYKQHVNHCEYIFVATKYAREYIRNLLLQAKRKSGLTSKDINHALGTAENGGGMWSIYTGNNKCNQVPTKEQWNKFEMIFDGLPKYSEFEEFFKNDIGKGNVLTGYNFRMKNRVHPTQTPLELMEYLLHTYTAPGSIVLDFFMGSGTTGVACLNLGRDFIGIEKERIYFDAAKLRLGV